MEKEDLIKILELSLKSVRSGINFFDNNSGKEIVFNIEITDPTSSYDTLGSIFLLTKVSYDRNYISDHSIFQEKYYIGMDCNYYYSESSENCELTKDEFISLYKKVIKKQDLILKSIENKKQEERDRYLGRISEKFDLNFQYKTKQMFIEKLDRRELQCEIKSAEPGGYYPRMLVSENRF